MALQCSSRLECKIFSSLSPNQLEYEYIYVIQSTCYYRVLKKKRRKLRFHLRSRSSGAHYIISNGWARENKNAKEAKFRSFVIKYFLATLLFLLLFLSFSISVKILRINEPEDRFVKFCLVSF